MPRRVLFGTVFAFIMVLVLSSQHLLAQVPPAAGSLIRLKHVTFDPRSGEPAIPSALRTSAAADGQSIYLVQFAGPVKEEWQAAATQAGAKLYGYIPDHTFIARIDASALVQVRALPFVRWVGLYHTAYRLDVGFATIPDAGSVSVTAQTLPDANLDVLAAQVAGWGGVVEGRALNQIAGYLRATLPAGHLADLAAQTDVVWVAPYAEPQLFNNIGGGQIMRADQVRQSLGLFGAGQVVAVADTGMDLGDANNIHADFQGRLIKGYCLGRPSPCDWSDPNAHGTHVAGSVLGSGKASGSNPAAHQYPATSFPGVAPEAKLVMQSIQAANGSLAGIPDDRGDLMRQTYADGARIHTNSWGGQTGGTNQQPEYGGYVPSSQEVDQAAWEHKDMLILFAAGNQGTDANGNGVVDPDSIAQPGTAKNIITVGASENLRSTGGFNPGSPDCGAWGECWPDDFGSSPLANDTPSDDVNGMAAFSSRGPTDDGRIKPEIVAPGTNILSTRSHHQDASAGWGTYPANNEYIFEGGTSMATPLTAGAAALVREWLTRIKGMANPSSALMKGILLNGAADMSPGQYGTGAAQEISSQRPNNVSGWGRVDLVEALNPAAPRAIWFTDNTGGLSTGQDATYQVTVGSGQVQHTHPGVSRAARTAAAGRMVGSTGITPQGTAQLVQNGGFESASLAPWGAFGNPALDTGVKHSGARSVRLGGTNDADDEIEQALSIPADATDVTIDFWYRFDTSETVPASDEFCYGLWDPSTDEWFMERCGDFAEIGDLDWTRETYSLSAGERASVVGKSAILVFYVVTDFALPSRAWVDDVTLTVTTPDGGNPTPTPPTPTPTTPPSAGGQLRVTLVWTDYPGEPAAAKALVNDLDLEIIGPDNQRYTGNGGLYTSGQCLRDGKWDACNNAEGIILPKAGPGTYTIVVHGAQVPKGGRQPFALVASGNALQGPGGLRPSVYVPLVARSATISQSSGVTPASTPVPAAMPAQTTAIGQEMRRPQSSQP